MSESQAARRQRELLALEQSGMFDAAWYAAHHADVGHSGVDPAGHYIDTGWQEGRRPNFYMDPAWYLATHVDVREAGLNPVLHYILHGDAEGRAPGPHFDPAWYRTTYGLAPEERALPHYLAARLQGASPCPGFDAAFYLATYRDVARAGVDPFEHYVRTGWQEGREPSPEFDSAYYIKAHMGGHAAQPPLLHWLARRHDPGIHTRMPEETPTMARAVRHNTRPGAYFERPVPLPDGVTPRAKLLAYYLPQFHAIAENDAWWGTGFTEWTNLGRGMPRFAGHYQPRIPRDLGHYHLGGPDAGADVMRRQIRMAKSGGLHGFIFYWYWFNGHRLLEKPVEAFLRDRSLDMPFALMWANENWTRRWDGAESDVLMSQDYRAAEEAALVAELARHFADPRYIRVQGRPVLMMYRASLMPEAARTVEGWRRRFREAHGEDPVFVMAQSFDDEDPRPLGFDGAIEFPPHKLAKRTTPISASLNYLDPDFSGTVFNFDEVVRASLQEPAPSFPLIKCAVPGWDNDPRKQGQGTVVIHGATPASYQAWLAALVDRAVANPFLGEPLVCVNAWNEWCEGAYLEPDLHFGAAFLNATGRAVTAGRVAGAPSLLVAAADAADTPANARLIEAARCMRRGTGIELRVLLQAGGPREEDFARLGPVQIVPEGIPAALDSVRAEGTRHMLIGLSAATSMAARAAERGINVTLLAEEMQGEVRARGLGGALAAALRHATTVVAPAASMLEGLLARARQPVRSQVIEPGREVLPRFDPVARAEMRTQLGVPAGAPLLLGAGPGDLRHGIDLFLQLFRSLKPTMPELRAIWSGALDPQLRPWLGTEIAALAPQGLRLVEALAHPGTLLSTADLLALTAREGAAPGLAQEAVAVGLPIVAFVEAGGGAALAEAFGGASAPIGDVAALAAIAAPFLAAPRAAEARAAAHAVAKARFDAAEAAAALLRACMPDLPEIAVIIDGAGQGGLLASRLDSVFSQDRPISACLVIDDPADPRVAAGALSAASRWRRLVKLIPAGSDPLAQTGAALVWCADPAVAPGPSFLRMASELLARMPEAEGAVLGSASEGGPILWRRAALHRWQASGTLPELLPLTGPAVRLLDRVAPAEPVEALAEPAPEQPSRRKRAARAESAGGGGKRQGATAPRRNSPR